MMKPVKILLTLSVSAILYSCGGSSTDKKDGGSTSSGGLKKGMNVDFKMLDDPEMIKKLHAEALDKLGSNSSKTDEVSMSVDRSSEGMIQHKGEPDDFYYNVVYQSPKDPNKVMDVRYDAEYGWQQPEEKEIKIIIGDAESFKLSDELFDFAKVTPDIITKAINDGKTTFDVVKYDYLYPQYVTIKKSGISITYHGKLKANGVEKSESYDTDLSGAKK